MFQVDLIDVLDVFFMLNNQVQKQFYDNKNNKKKKCTNSLALSRNE